MEAFPPAIVSVEIRFLCSTCGAKLIVDARWQGRAVTCLKCGVGTHVPFWSLHRPRSDSPSSAAVPRIQLSSAEIEFLSGAIDSPASAGAA